MRNRRLSAIKTSSLNPTGGPSSAVNEIPTTEEPDTGQRYFNTASAAMYLGLSARMLEGMRVRGDGPIFHKLGPRKGAKVAYRAADLDAWRSSFRFSCTSEYETLK